MTFTEIVADLNRRYEARNSGCAGCGSTIETMATYGRIDTSEVFAGRNRGVDAWAETSVGIIVSCGEWDGEGPFELHPENLLGRPNANGSEDPYCCDMLYRSTDCVSLGLSAGTGTLITNELVLTARHVLDLDDEGNIPHDRCIVFGWLALDRGGTLPESVAAENVRRFKKKTVSVGEGAGKENDWAIAKIETPRNVAQGREIAFAAPTPGLDVHAFGHPFGTPMKHAHDATILDEPGSTFEASLDVTRGFSGAAVLDRQGRIVGIVVENGKLTRCIPPTDAGDLPRWFSMDLETGEEVPMLEPPSGPCCEDCYGIARCSADRCQFKTLAVSACVISEKFNELGFADGC